MTKTLTLLFLFVLATTGCDIAKIVGPDDAIPIYAALDVRNSEPRTVPGYVRIRTTGGVLAEKVLFGQVATIDLRRAQAFSDGRIYISAEGWSETPGGLVYLGCERYTVDLSNTRNGVPPWAVNRVSLGNDC